MGRVGFVLTLVPAMLMAAPAAAQLAQGLRIPQQVDFTERAGELREAAHQPAMRSGRRLRTGPEDDRPTRLQVGAGGVEAGLRRFGVRDGSVFRDQGRLYLFAADGETAVGYNITAGDDGWTRRGLSLDEGAFLGEAQAGVAWRKGATQTSFGYVRREFKRQGRIGRSTDDDYVALQFSFTPGR